MHVPFLAGKVESSVEVVLVVGVLEEVVLLEVMMCVVMVVLALALAVVVVRVLVLVVWMGRGCMQCLGGSVDRL